MTMPETISRSRSWAGIAGACLLALTLAGCGSSGFQPMYAASSYGGGLSAKMAAVEITTIPGRVGQRIRNELVFQSTGGGEKAPAKYRLDIAITERVTSTLVTATGDSAGQIYQVAAKFKLVELGSGRVMLKGDSHARAGFERFKTIFSNVRAREDAENRTARSIARDLKSRLEAFLAST